MASMIHQNGKSESGSKTDIMLSNVVLGNKAAVAGVNADSTKSIGDVEIVGLDMIGAQIAVRGH